MGLAVEVIECLRGQFQQILVSPEVLGQQDQVCPIQFAGQVLLIGLETEDWLFAGLLHCLVVLQEPVHIAMVGQSTSILSMLDHLRYSGHAVHQRVVAVPVEVRKADHHSRTPILLDDNTVLIEAKATVVEYNLFDGSIHTLQGPVSAVPADMQVGPWFLRGFEFENHVSPPFLCIAFNLHISKIGV